MNQSSEYLPIYAVACYGTGNLGDDAIFNGFRTLKGRPIHQIYSLRPTSITATDIQQILTEGFPEDGRLVIGGGGLFFDERISKELGNVVRRAKQRGMPVTMRAVGLETADADCYPLMVDVVKECQSVTVRSLASRNILRSQGIRGVKVEHDFAYHLVPDVEAAKQLMPEFEIDAPIVGLATAGSGDTEFVAKIVSLLATRVNVLHIPHARHFDDPNNNEIATGQLIWSGISVYSDDKARKYQCLPYPETPEALLGVYSLLNGVVGYRYHSFIFAEMTKTPIFGMPHGDKANAYFDEHPGIPHSDGTEERDDLVWKILGNFNKCWT